MINRKKERESPQINASSMADIAFLLLIFFLVTTKIDSDKGMTILLPPYSEAPPPDIEIKDKNVFKVLVNSKDQLLVEDKPTEIEQLRSKAIEFIDNNGKVKDLSDNPQKAVISFRGDRGTSYKRYIEVYNELRAAYSDLRNDYSKRRYGTPYLELKEADSLKIEDIRNFYPLNISESDPVDFSK